MTLRFLPRKPAPRAALRSERTRIRARLSESASRLQAETRAELRDSPWVTVIGGFAGGYALASRESRRREDSSRRESRVEHALRSASRVVSVGRILSVLT